MTDITDQRYQVTTETPKDLPTQFFKKSHELIFSQLGLSAREHDMMALFLSRLHEDHWKDYLDKKDIHAPRYTFHSDVLKDWFGLSAKQLYPTLRPAAERLAGRKVGIANEGAEEFDFIPLFSRVQYKKGQLSVVPNSELINAYIDYSAGHGQINHKAFRSLKSEHSKRLYTILSRFKDKGKLHPQSMSQLHGLFGLLDEKGKLLKRSYAQNKVFIERCIKKPIEEMSRSPDVMAELQFSRDDVSGNLGFAPVMRGRKIVSVEFLYHWRKSDQKALDVEQQKLLNEPPPDNPMLTLACEAWKIVMSFPHSGKLNERHTLAIQSVKMGIITMPADMPMDHIFESKWNRIK